MSNKQNSNDLTLQSYQDKTQEYVAGTPPIDDAIKAWIDHALSLMPRDGKVLEVGSGFGRDAEYIQQKGVRIECSDAVPNFVELLQQKGYAARLLNLLTDDLGRGYDMVFADAVLLHFTPEEFAVVAKKIHEALNSNGIFALRMKKGDGPVWSKEKLGEPRYFYYWKPENLKSMLADAGFEWLAVTESCIGRNNVDWIHVIAQKI